MNFKCGHPVARARQIAEWAIDEKLTPIIDRLAGMIEEAISTAVEEEAKKHHAHTCIPKNQAKVMAEEDVREEREACAKVADNLEIALNKNDPVQVVAGQVKKAIAQAIRQRSDNGVW